MGTYFLNSVVAVSSCAMCFILYWLAIAIYNIFFHPLSDVPGPKLWAISNLPYVRRLVLGQWPFVLKSLHDQYGPVVRFTPDDVSFISASAWKDIYGYKKAGQPTFQKDRRLYRGSLTAAPNILIGDDADHSRMRRLLAHAFSERALRGQEDIMKRYMDLLITKLRGHASKGEAVDLVKWYNFTTFDIIGNLSFGEDFGCLDSGGYHPWVAMIFGSFKLSNYNQAIKRLPRLAPLLRYLLPQSLLKNQREHMQLSFEKAKQRAESGYAEREDFMSYILRHNDEKGMSADEIGENSNVLIVAGSETTATLLSGVTYFLLKEPRIYQKLAQEVRSAFENEDDITILNVNKLEYLLATLNEALRMYPPIPSGLPRIVPKGGEHVDGYWFPENSAVSLSHWSAYHSSRNFHLPDQFIPERWLNDERFTHDIRDVVQPFSFGPRNCLGRNLAFAEMRLILARMLWNFDIEIQPDSADWMAQQQIYTFWEKGALNVKLAPRV